MRFAKIVAGLTATTAAGILLLASPASAAPKTCDPAAIAAAQAAIGEKCPCAGTTAPDGSITPWKNHGQYVRCVAQETTRQVRTSGGELTRRCLQASVRCSARSTCGKRDSFVACRIHDDCIGDAAPGDGAAAGLCAGDGTTACDTGGDCPVLRCSVRSSTDACDRAGGAAGSGSCCD
jgi:hypothetical protein